MITVSILELAAVFNGKRFDVDAKPFDDVVKHRDSVFVCSPCKRVDHAHNVALTGEGEPGA